ncbi:MAG: dihydroorotase [Minisyncoccia bacterium]
MAMKVGEIESSDGLHETITFTRPDDWHLHLRDGAAMVDVVGYSARRGGRALIMPNLGPPITSTIPALNYYKRIKAALPKDTPFQPFMTLYLTDNTSPDEIDCAVESGLVKAVKYYPAGATTNSDAGVTDIKKVYRVLERMQELGMVLCMHGEVTDPSVDVFDREAVFIDKVFLPLRERFFRLKIVLEHITTGKAVDLVKDEAEVNRPTVATITAHHLLANRNDMLGDKLNPHLFCKPILKQRRDQLALIRAATSGDPWYFLGTDSAPHAQDAKECACGCAGCFTAHAGIELYAEVFEAAKALDKLEGFASHFGADFYGLPRNTDTITLVKEPWEVPFALAFGDKTVVPFRADEVVRWKMK